MRISVDTKEDSHDDIRRVIKMLQNLIGDSQEIIANQPISESSSDTSTQNVFNNIFGDTSSQVTTNASEAVQEKAEETESTEDLFAELFSDEELKKMDKSPIKDDDEEEVKPKGKKYNIELY